jgi:hypothetical protein
MLPSDVTLDYPYEANDFMNSVADQEAELLRKPTLQEEFDLSTLAINAGFNSFQHVCDRFGGDIGYTYKLFPRMSELTMAQVQHLTILLREHKAAKLASRGVKCVK